MADLRLGKLPPKLDSRTLRLADYVNFAALPPPLPVLDLTTHINPPLVWPMDGNDRLGDCTIAAFAHMTQLWTAMSLRPKNPTERSIENLYYAIGRTENPGQTKPDNGLAMLDVCNWMTRHSLATEKVAVYVKADLHNHDHIKQAVGLFGGVYIGFGIANAQQTFSEFNNRQDWTPQFGTVTEGHAVNIVSYDALGVECISWGRTQRGTWEWWDAMVDEAYAILPASWKVKGRIPNGLDFGTLQVDLAAIRAA